MIKRKKQSARSRRDQIAAEIIVMNKFPRRFMDAGGTIGATKQQYETAPFEEWIIPVK